jgi:hypothetical protein
MNRRGLPNTSTQAARSGRAEKDRVPFHSTQSIVDRELPARMASRIESV